MITNGDIRLIRRWAKNQGVAWRPVFARFRNATEADKAELRRLMKESLGAAEKKAA